MYEFSHGGPAATIILFLVKSMVTDANVGIWSLDSGWRQRPTLHG